MARDESKNRISANTVQGVILAEKIQNVTQNFFGTSPAASFSKGPVAETTLKEEQEAEESPDEKGLSILHLSDFHFGTMADTELWYSQLADDLKGDDLKCHKLDAVILSGDIGTNTEPGEYEAAKTFLEKLVNEFAVDRRRLVIVPGNHDLNREISRKKGYRLIDRDELKSPPKEGFFIKESDSVIRIRDEAGYKERFQSFSAFYQAVKGDPYPSDYGPQGIIHHLEEVGLLIAGFNSAWEMDYHFKYRSSICPDAVSQVLDRIRENEIYRNCLKFAVWHHPLNSHKECRIKDHGFLERLAAAGFCVCFHGHIHKPETGLFQYEEGPEGKKIKIIGAGTSGALPKDLIPGIPLQYNFIRIVGNKLAVETRCRRIINGPWEPYAIWRQPGKKDPLPRYFFELPGKVKMKPLPSKKIDPVKEEKAHTNLESEIREYCKKAEALYEKMSLAGFKTPLRVSIRIEDIYVPLRAMMDVRPIGKACFADAEEAEKKLLECRGGKEISLPQAFKETEKTKRRGIVILGDPGSGKTTHLKRILLWCLKGGLEELWLPAGMIPVFLPLRELKGVDQNLDDFIQAQLDKPNMGTPKGFGERLLKRGNLLFLLDGLDEVVDSSERKRVSRWIEGALQTLDSCRFLVTCRFAGYTEEARLNEEFFEMHMRPLKEEEARSFIHNWYRVIETACSSNPEQAEIMARTKAEDLTTKLKQPEFKARRVFELTRNPLLLTNICLVHLSRGNLPHTRAALYEECTEVLLERWRESVGIKTRFTAQTGRKTLQPAAWWMHQEQGRTKASAEELSPIIDPVLKGIDWSHGSARDFLKAVRDESGLLTGWDQEHYGFMHLGFQEYLAAREVQNKSLKDKNIFRELASHFGESWWQEVILLALALDNPAIFDDFMREVIKQPSFASQGDLLEMCLDETSEKTSRPFVELLEQAPGKDQGLWERQFMALKMVERLKDPAVDRLPDQLLTHPYGKIQTWCRSRKGEKDQEVIRAVRGGYELVRIPGGIFMMGSPKSEEGRYDDEILHEVRVSDFYMGRYPVTNEEYGRFMQENTKITPPEYWDNRKFNQPRQPVVGLSWHDANQYAQWAGLRLPTEAQWEYACRAGTKGKYYTGDTEADLDRAGWYEKNSGEKLHPVGEKEVNSFGLYDMHGNVWEWCLDSCDLDGEKGLLITDTYKDGVVDPLNTKGSGRVLRGGSWVVSAGGCRAAYRRGFDPSSRSAYIGFRLVLLPGQQG